MIDSQAGVSGGTVNQTILILASDTPDLATTNEVQTGATVNAIYLKVEANNTEAVQGVLANAYMYVGKNPGGNLVLPTPNVVGVSDNKKYVIHQEMVMFQKAVGSNPRTLFNGVISIPRGYRRFGPLDQLDLNVFAPGVDMDLCIQCHYKEFR